MAIEGITYFIRNGSEDFTCTMDMTKAFDLYMKDLNKKLREKKTGCWINGDFVGIVGYADDNCLMSPTLDGLQEMLDTCEEYANEHNLTFRTNDNPNKSKTKCMAFLKKKRTLKNCHGLNLLNILEILS